MREKLYDIVFCEGLLFMDGSGYAETTALSAELGPETIDNSLRLFI
jgi:hypothetical protein